MIIQRIIVYGAANGGKYVTALKLKQDNPFLDEPFVVTSVESMKHFLSGTHSLGIITAPSVDHILAKCAGINLGGVLFIADPTATEQAGEDLISEVIWGGGSAQETLEKLHANPVSPQG